MKTDFLRAVACVALVALAGTLNSASAQDVQLASTAEMNNVYARLAELESRVAAGNIATSGGPSCGAVSDCGYDDGCCDRSGLIIGTDILFLRPYDSEGNLSGFDYEEAFRFWAGWQAAGGMGVRLRYFDYEDENTAGDALDIATFDAEVYDAVQLGCNWDLNIGGGIRYLDYEMENVANTAPGLDEVTGVGPVVSAELVRHFRDRAAAYAIVRESIIVGDGFVNGVDTSDITCAISEIQLGLQAHRDWRNGGLLFARVGWEAQYYHDVGHAPESSVSLMGGVFSLGIMR
jgi:hypothetical protein